MKRLLLAACTTLVVLGLPARAIAQPDHEHGDSPKTTMTLIHDVAVGSTVLRPGQYRFQCRTIEGKTFLIVTSIDSGKELARVPCVREALGDKVTASEFRTLTRDGGRVLTVVRIKGETVEHRVVVN